MVRRNRFIHVHTAEPRPALTQGNGADRWGKHSTKTDTMTKTKKRTLAPNPHNPRRITNEQREKLADSLKEFGDLGGIVYNLTTEQTVGGHQRVSQFRKARDFKIEIMESFEEPLKDGTVSRGFITANQNRYAYREVQWTAAKENAANLAANQQGGEWDESKLTEMLKDMPPADLALTGFPQDELDHLLEAPAVPRTPRPKVLKVVVECESKAEQKKIFAQQKRAGRTVRMVNA